MKCIWKIPNKNNLDEGIDCPTCQSVLITFDGNRMLCPSCAGREIDRLRKSIKLLKRQITNTTLPKGTRGGVEVTIVDGVIVGARVTRHA